MATTCGQCPAGCGVRVRVFEGRAVKIEGNPSHPINGGGIGPKGQSGLQLLYHPDRIPGPLRRDGPRGSGKWRPVDWNSALAEIAARLHDIRRNGPEGLVVLDGEPRGMVPRLLERFLAAYGSPNHVRHTSATDGGILLAARFMQGLDDAPAYDWRNTGYVLAFGVDLFESWCQAIHAARATSGLHRGRPGRRAKLVHVSSRFSVTAAKADEWVPIEPATEGALALGLAHVLVRERLCDEAFLRDHTFGFEPWTDSGGRRHRGFRDLVLGDYPPQSVARITGVPGETIERLAREVAAHRPALALGGGPASAATNALGTAMAVHALNALLGSVERPGGLRAQRTVLGGWKPSEPDEVARRGRAAERVDGGGTARYPLGEGALQLVPEAVLCGRPYPVKAVFLYRSNPMFSKPEGARWAEALRRVPLVVSFSPLPDESTFEADFVLPDHTYLERWELVEPAPSAGQPVLGLRQPVVPPRYDTMATGDVVVRLAHAVGGPVSAALPWADARAASTELLAGVAGASGGAPALLTELGEAGAWSGEQTAQSGAPAFATPSGRFEFYSQEIAARLSARFPTGDALESALAANGVVTRGDDLCLPHWEPARRAGTADAYPFLLVPYRGIDHAEGGARHLPWLRELPASGLLAWEETIELHPDDARRLDVRQGDHVRVESPAGRRVLRVRVQPGTRVATAGIRLGHGPWPPSLQDAGRAGGHALLAALADPLAGLLAHQGTRVRIVKEDA